MWPPREMMKAHCHHLIWEVRIWVRKQSTRGTKTEPRQLQRGNDAHWRHHHLPGSPNLRFSLEHTRDENSPTTLPPRQRRPHAPLSMVPSKEKTSFGLLTRNHHQSDPARSASTHSHDAELLSTPPRPRRCYPIRVSLSLATALLSQYILVSWI
jgi:hypothetical protein